MSRALSPFAPADELHAETPGEDDTNRPAPADAGGDRAEIPGAAAPPPRVRIDFAGIFERLEVVPVPAGNYGNLSVNSERLFWTVHSDAGGDTMALRSLEIGNEDPDPITLLSGIRGYELAGDGRHLLVRKEDSFHVLDAPSGPAPEHDDVQVDLSAWTFPIDPREKWRQMFVESWRLERDYFYDPQMHGLDWLAVLQKYLPLVDRLTDRNELANLQAQMAGELGALHTGVWGGDFREPEVRVETASPGAVLHHDPAAGGCRVARVYRVDPDEPEQLAPLARSGVTVAAGEVITAINGVDLRAVADPGLLLRAQADRQVRLAVKSTQGKLREVIVTPIAPGRAKDLRCDESEYTRRLMTDSLGAGNIGYVHLRAMGTEDMAQWQRDFYPVFNRRGLIVDARHNNGGNIDSWILAKLLRRAWMYWQPWIGAPYWNMQQAFRGHLVVLVDEWTMSDGEALAEGFRRLRLGQVIGTLTWGGEI